MGHNKRQVLAEGQLLLHLFLQLYLDIQIQVQPDNNISWKFYDKAVSSPFTILNSSAMPRRSSRCLWFKRGWGACETPVQISSRHWRRSSWKAWQRRWWCPDTQRSLELESLLCGDRLWGITGSLWKRWEATISTSWLATTRPTKSKDVEENISWQWQVKAIWLERQFVDIVNQMDTQAFQKITKRHFFQDNQVSF